ncbi:probable E3 ubiquitin-protein ligase bre1 [Trichogramma pretiosum]|uniref:probable E3 ubiquitin-protein ligase bre1 n=1 Tax=Trichogramma pretiosum TaxID=7493 RepID=UPI0006C9BE66|nr:probable E3 ubiquitin-protein ligase bre1 [Trichogramma pretiosum]
MSNSTTPVSEARLRRRPARYSPDNMQPSSSSNNNNNSSSSRNNSGADSSQQLQYQATNGETSIAASGGAAAGAAADPHQDELLRLAALAEKGLLPEGSENNSGQSVTTRSKTPRINLGYKKRKYTRRKPVNNNGSFVNNGNGNEQQATPPQPPTKRPRVANVLLENEILIDEIRARKALWMRTHDQHHSNLLTAPLWDEIANILDSTPENVKRRWKSMKDHYRRELKKEMTDPASPKSPWPYYKKMKFMKSQMFVSMRRTDGDQELEILSADEEDLTNEWQNSLPRKREIMDDSEAMDQYGLDSEMRQLVKYENRVLAESNAEQVDDSQEDMEQQQIPEEEQEEQEVEEEEEEQEVEQDDEQDGLQDESLQDHNPLDSTITSIENLVHMPNMTTTTASALSQRMSMEHQNQQLNGMMNQSPSAHINNSLNEMPDRHSVMQHINNIQPSSGIQQRVNIDALRQQNNMAGLQQQVHINRLEHPQMQQPVNNSENMISDDYHFFMSLVPHVKHFNTIQKLKVRSRIQQIILDEISNSHDPLAN